MSFSTVSLTAYHYVLPISPYTGVISIPRRKDPRRRRKARVLPRAAIVEARPQALLAIKEVTGGNNAVPFRRRDSSFRDRTGDMQAEARAMTRAANASVYSPELLLVKYGSRPVRVLRRTLEIFIGLGSFGFKLWLDQLNGQLNQNKRLRAIQLRNIFTRLGPTFVKIGQGLSTRPDLCPPEYLEELSELQVIWMRK